MKIALVTHTYLPSYKGGRESFLYDLSMHLQRRNIDVELFVGDDVKTISHDEYNNVLVHRFPMRTVTFMGFPYRFVSPLFLWSIHKFNPDLIHCLSYRHYTTDLSLLYAKFSRTPILISIHGLGHFPTSFFKKILWLYDNTIGKIILRFVDCIVAYPFKDSLEEPLKKFKFKTVFINPAIDISKFKHFNLDTNFKKLYGLDNCFILLNVGRETINDYKGHKFLVEAFSNINLPNCKLLIAGTKTVQIQGNITKLGYVDPDLLGSLYQLADVFVQTSKFESCSRVLIEALCFGLPIISTPVGIAPYVVNENIGFLVNYGDYTGFKKAVNNIYDGEFKPNLGVKYVKLFDWNKIIYDFIKAYEGLIKK